MMRLFVVAALAVGLAMPASGHDFDAGLAAYERGDYAAALKEWKPPDTCRFSLTAYSTSPADCELISPESDS